MIATLNITAHTLVAQAHGAGLVDVDVTALVQSLFFLLLVFTLPKLIFEPMLKRFDQREARTEGARAEARRMLKESDEQVQVFEKAMADEKTRARAERAAARMQAQREANETVAKVRRETNERIDAGIAALSAEAAKAQAELDVEAKAISALIVQKILAGRAS
jgi:F-type H+-transporting ATPase subunit b